jgi:hypothetical protein
MISHALHPSIFEQPSPIDFFNTLLDLLCLIFTQWVREPLIGFYHSCGFSFNNAKKIHVQCRRSHPALLMEPLLI